jgi:hypothetical protein
MKEQLVKTKKEKPVSGTVEQTLGSVRNYSQILLFIGIICLTIKI